MPAGVGEGVWQRQCGSEVREGQMKQPCCVSGSNAQKGRRRLQPRHFTDECCCQ